MKRFVLAIALTGLMSMTALAGEIPINGAPAPLAGDIPTNGAPAPLAGDIPINGAPATSSTVLVTLILTVLSLR